MTWPSVVYFKTLPMPQAIRETLQVAMARVYSHQKFLREKAQLIRQGRSSRANLCKWVQAAWAEPRKQMVKIWIIRQATTLLRLSRCLRMKSNRSASSPSTNNSSSATLKMTESQVSGETMLRKIFTNKRSKFCILVQGVQFRSANHPKWALRKALKKFRWKV